MTCITPPPHAFSTLTGRWIDVLNLDPAQVHMDDVARGLAYTCRWAGGVPAYYSVAEHSVYVASVVADACGHYALYRAALLHDAAEAYLGDVPSPYKTLVAIKHGTEDGGFLENFHEVEDRMLRVVFAVAGCPWPDEDEWADIHAADLVVRHAEQTMRREWSRRQRLGELPRLHPREDREIEAAFDHLTGAGKWDGTLPEIRCWNPDRARTRWTTELWRGGKAR